MPRQTRTHLLTVLALLVAAVGVTGCEVAVGSWQAEQKEAWNRDYPIEAGGRFELTNTNGRITVAASADARIHVRAEKVAKGVSEEAARESLKQMEIVEEVDGDSVSLRTRTPSGKWFGNNGRVEYTVEVPATLSVKVVNTNGHIEVNALEGAVDLETTNGGIDGRGLRGTVRAETTNGGVELELARIADGGVEVSTTNGGVTLVLPANAAADLSASCTNGGIHTSGLTLETRESSRRRLEATINGGGPRVRAETTNGGIRFSGLSGT